MRGVPERKLRLHFIGGSEAPSFLHVFVVTLRASAFA
jgi:hypothetical protein